MKAHKSSISNATADPVELDDFSILKLQKREKNGALFIKGLIR